jgi:hypothetical protein
VAVLDQPIRKQEKHRPSEILAELELFLEKKHGEVPKIQLILLGKHSHNISMTHPNFPLW